MTESIEAFMERKRADLPPYDRAAINAACTAPVRTVPVEQYEALRDEVVGYLEGAQEANRAARLHAAEAERVLLGLADDAQHLTLAEVEAELRSELAVLSRDGEPVLAELDQLAESLRLAVEAAA